MEEGLLTSFHIPDGEVSAWEGMVETGDRLQQSGERSPFLDGGLDSLLSPAAASAHGALYFSTSSSEVRDMPQGTEVLPAVPPAEGLGLRHGTARQVAHRQPASPAMLGREFRFALCCNRDCH